MKHMLSDKCIFECIKKINMFKHQLGDIDKEPV